MITTSNEPTRRERWRQATCEEILETARRQMAAQGAATLSLRAIAREMRLSAPALYRYFDNRDALVTALIIAAYNSLADALQAGRDSRPAGDHAGRLFAACTAYRAWALEHPQDYALIFGTPIPGYVAPYDITEPAAKRSMDVLVGVLQAAKDAGRLKPDPALSKPSAILQKQLDRWKNVLGYSASTVALHIALVGWSRLHGMILLELFHHVEPFFGDLDEFYRVEVLALLKQVGLAAPRAARSSAHKSI